MQPQHFCKDLSHLKDAVEILKSVFSVCPYLSKGKIRPVRDDFVRFNFDLNLFDIFRKRYFVKI